jgi:hypothetical protein
MTTRSYSDLSDSATTFDPEEQFDRDRIEDGDSSLEILARNQRLDEEEALAKKNRWRFLCWVLPHIWNYTHLFDDEPNYDLPFGMHRGSSNYAGVCRRCGKRDLFSGTYRG